MSSCPALYAVGLGWHGTNVGFDQAKRLDIDSQLTGESTRVSPGWPGGSLFPASQRCLGHPNTTRHRADGEGGRHDLRPFLANLANVVRSHIPFRVPGIDRFDLKSIDRLRHVWSSKVSNSRKTEGRNTRVTGQVEESAEFKPRPQVTSGRVHTKFVPEQERRVH